jgi:hypothetical protein
MKTTEMNAHQKQIAEKLKKRYPTDERVSAVNEKALAACGCAAILYTIGRLVYCGFRGEFALPEFILLMVMAALLLTIKDKNGVYELPTVLGKRLSPERSARPGRVGLYALQSALMAGMISAISILSRKEAESPLKSALLFFPIGFAVVFLFEFLWNERRVRLYQAQNAVMEEDENDLS